MPVSDTIKSHIQSQLDQHIDAIKAFVQVPSVSLEKEALDEGAAFATEMLKSIGCADAEVVDLGDGYPGVWGSLDFGKAKTVMVYSHYDVRPVGTEPWSHGPFDGDIVAFAGFDKAIVGRGASAKGPLIAFLMALKAMIAVEGSLPVNVKFLFEGAEILGSPNYTGLVEAKREQLRGVTALYGPRATQDGAGNVSFTLGYKGLTYIDLVATSSAWGRGPDGGSIHSSTNVVVDNVAWRLAHALATMTDPQTGAITIPALQDAFAKRKVIEDWEQPLVADLAARLTSNDPNSVLPGLNGDFPVRAFKGGLSGEDLAKEYLYGPGMNLSSLRSGYTGPGTKAFLLPHEARATIDLRLVTDVTAHKLIQIIRDHLDANGFNDIRIETRGAYDWYQTPLTADLISAAVNTLTDQGYGYRAWALQAFGGPWAHYGREFGIPSLQGAAPGHGGRGATSDEFYVLEGKGKIAGLLELELHFLAFLKAYADMP